MSLHCTQYRHYPAVSQTRKQHQPSTGNPPSPEKFLHTAHSLRIITCFSFTLCTLFLYHQPVSGGCSQYISFQSMGCAVHALAHNIIQQATHLARKETTARCYSHSYTLLAYLPIFAFALPRMLLASDTIRMKDSNGGGGSSRSSASVRIGWINTHTHGERERNEDVYPRHICGRKVYEIIPFFCIVFLYRCPHKKNIMV